MSNTSDYIDIKLLNKDPKLLISMGFGEFEKKHRQVEIVSASEKWIKFITSWKDSFDETVGDVKKLNVYQINPKIFEGMNIIGRLWGAVVINLGDKYNENICKLSAYRPQTKKEKGQNMLITLILEDKKEKENNNDG